MAGSSVLLAPPYRSVGRRAFVADPRAFVSFDFDHDDTQRDMFCGQGRKRSPTPFVVQDWSSKYALPNKTWEETIREKISRCHMLIVLVGRYMSTARGVSMEIAMAKEIGVPVFGVYVDGAGTSSTLPAGLARNRVIFWKWADIAAGIRQMMGEGKNKKR
jgi:hypothetical protein